MLSETEESSFEHEPQNTAQGNSTLIDDDKSKGRTYEDNAYQEHVDQRHFSESLDDEEINQVMGSTLYYFNTSLIDMYLEPEANWHGGDDDFEMQKINLTYNCTGFKDDKTLQFRLHFSSPPDVSPMTEQDTLVVDLTQAVKHGYMASNKGVDIRREDHVLRRKVRL